jgi:NTP pyrophosphatase (non-canonical NTP hydrolase)
MEMKEAQKRAGEIHRKVSKEQWTGFMIATDLLEEAGEVAAEIKALEGLKTRKGEKEKLADELADLLYSTFLIAEKYNIAIEDVYLRKISKYEKRYKK